MIDPRCRQCCEHMTVLGSCGGYVMDDVGDHSRLACFTPMPMGAPEIDELSGELVGELPQDETITGPEFPVGLVGRLLSSGPACIPSAAAVSLHRAAHEAEPGAAAASLHRAARAGPCAREEDLRCGREPHEPAGVLSGLTRERDYRGSRAVRPIRGRFATSVCVALIALAATVAAAVATDGPASPGPAAMHGPRGGRPGVYQQSTIFVVTAYCPCKKCCGPNAKGITASGKPVSANGGRFVAADGRIPFGTRIRVPGYAAGTAVPVLDRGGKIKGDRIDVFFPTHAAAKEWGRKTLTVEVMK